MPAQKDSPNLGSKDSVRNGGLSPKALPQVQRRQSNLSQSVSLNGTNNSNKSQSSLASTSLGSQSPNPNQEVDIVFIDPLDKKYECPVCEQVLRYPVQFEECGHRCCSSCLPELIRVAPRCPLDQIQVDREKVYVDKAFQREIDNLGIRCTYSAAGCPWTGILKELMNHLETCDFRLVVCPIHCGVEFEQRFLEKHQAEDCMMRQIVCQFCEKEMLAKEEAGHLEICPKFMVPCPNACKKKEIIREKLQEHLDTACNKQNRPCPFGVYGCEYNAVKKKLQDHLQENLVLHLGLLCEAVKDYSGQNDSKLSAIEACQTEITQYASRIDTLEKLYGCQLIWKIDNYQEKLTDATSGKKTTIFSPMFFTGRYGYKMAMSTCLYGDGKQRGKSMSVFICICKGEYDALLLWPFAHRITFTLLDQCQDPEARKNVVYSVKPNVCKENKPFLGRPTGERNASFGAQKFVELEVLSTLDYVRDNTIFIKVNVDCEDMVAL